VTVHHQKVSRPWRIHRLPIRQLDLDRIRIYEGHYLEVDQGSVLKSCWHCG
jgi:hypothetical protein